MTEVIGAHTILIELTKIERESVRILKIILSITAFGILVALIVHADPPALLRALSRISPLELLAAILIVQIQIVASALRWRFTAKKLNIDIGLRAAIREYFIASFVNQILPGGVAGDVGRAWRTRGSDSKNLGPSAKSVMFERFSGQIALFALVMLGLPFWITLLESSDALKLTSMLLVGVTILVAAIALLRAKVSRSPIIEDALNAFIRNGAWRYQAGASIIILSGYVGVFLIAAGATGPSPGWTAAFTIIPVCLFAMVIPTGFGGWGTREAAAMALWPMAGASSADGLAASVAYGILSLLGTLPGLFFLTDAIIRGRLDRA